MQNIYFKRTNTKMTVGNQYKGWRVTMVYLGCHRSNCTVKGQKFTVSNEIIQYLFTTLHHKAPLCQAHEDNYTLYFLQTCFCCRNYTTTFTTNYSLFQSGGEATSHTFSAFSKWNPNEVLTTFKAIRKFLASGFVYWLCALRQKP